MGVPIETRVLGGPDVEALRKMLAVFGEALGGLSTYTARQADVSYLRRLLESDPLVAIAAVTAGDVGGGLTAYVLPKFKQARFELFIYGLAASCAYRRRGVATSMIERLRKGSFTSTSILATMTPEKLRFATRPGWVRAAAVSRRPCPESAIASAPLVRCESRLMPQLSPCQCPPG